MSHSFRVISIIVAAIVLAACNAQGNGLPNPIATQESADLTALAENRPTLPPTFTPSPTWTLPVTETIPPTPITPTATVTLTLTLPPSLTPSQTLPPTLTPTWTPDRSFVTRTPGTPATVDPFVTPGTGTPASSAGDCPTGESLLLNGGFEGTTYVPIYDPAAVPEGWVAYWKPEGTPVSYDPNNGDGFRRPSWQVIPNTAPFDIPPRVRSGSHAFYLFGGNKVFDGGLYQQVKATIGETLCLGGSAHAWSAHQSDDPTRSTLVTEDDRLNVTFQVGIDPTGGTDAFAATVKWGQPGHLYDTYQAIPTIRAQAEKDTITVFIRGITRWRFDHNDLYFDDVRLVRATR